MVRFYSIPATCPTALEGEWRIGPGIKLTNAISESIGNAKIIAEDLGVVVDSVKKLIKKTGWPGMKILEFGFNGNPNNEYLPHNYKNTNYLVYGGTHDNETLTRFFQSKDSKEMQFIYDYLGVKRKADIINATIRLAYGSIAKVAIFQIQDILKLDNTTRMNIPSTVGGNWEWKMEKEAFTQKDRQKLKMLTQLYAR